MFKDFDWFVFPELAENRAIRKFIDDTFNTIVADYGEMFEIAFLPVLKFLNLVEGLLLAPPWLVVIAAFALISYGASRSWKASLAAAAMLAAIGLVGFWDEAMQSVALMITATALAILIGLPMGVMMSRSDRLESGVLPVLDIMQTLPIFVYLIPFMMLFGPGKIPALLATIVYAVPPMMRLTNLGVRMVDKEVVEASHAFGANEVQRLFGVQLPLALPNIMAGINQTTMMALSMVVIASLIGASGLGMEVLRGIQRLELGRGLFAGFCIVFIAIILDRIIQSYGRRIQVHRG